MAEDIKIRITADAAGVKTGATQAKTELQGIQSAGTAMAAGLRTSMIGISLAMTPIIAALTTMAALKGLVKIADDAVEAENKVALLAGRTQQVQPTISGAFTQIKNAVTQFAVAINEGTGMVGAIGRVMGEVAQVIALFAKQLTGAGTASDKLKSKQEAAEFARNVGRFFAWAGDIVSAVARIIIDAVKTIVGAVSTAGKAIGGLGTAMAQLASGDFSGAASTLRTTMTGVAEAIRGMVDKGVGDLKRLADAVTGNGALLQAYQNQVASGTSIDLTDPAKAGKGSGSGDAGGGGSGGGDSGDGLFSPEIYVKRMKDTTERLRQAFVHVANFGGGKGAEGGEQQGPLAQIMGAGLDTLPKTFGSALESILTRSKSFGQAMAGVWSTMRGAIVSEIGKIILAKLKAWAQEKGIALASISANAATAGSGAASSVASIPYVGPILAIAAMAAVLGSVLALGGNIKSAAGGFNIPSGLNPVTQLHQEEMVLPADIANPLRASLAGGGNNVTVQLQGVSAGEFFIANRSELARAIKAAHRDNAFLG